ncbi:hypothetical protein ABZP36_009051 [Zizania latifolia]
MVYVRRRSHLGDDATDPGRQRLACAGEEARLFAARRGGLLRRPSGDRFRRDGVGRETDILPTDVAKKR